MKFSFLSVFILLIITGCNKDMTGTDDNLMQIHYRFGHDNELDTFNNILTWDMVIDPDIKINFRLNKDEQAGILKKAFESDFFSMPDTFKFIPKDGWGISIEPNPGPLTLRIKTADHDKTVVIILPIVEKTENFNKLIELRNYVDSIIQANPEYKKLPEPRGGYL